jgi:hypothetical protein
MLAALLMAYGLLGTAEVAFATIYAPGRIYVPGHIRDGVYIRPHFVAAPKPAHGIWPAEPRAIEPKSAPPPLLQLAPGTARSKFGDPS